MTFAEREEIALGRAAGESIRSIADRLGLERNLERQGRYRASAAHALAYGRASRPKPAKLVTNLVLREKVEQDLAKTYSPEQIRVDPQQHALVAHVFDGTARARG